MRPTERGTERTLMPSSGLERRDRIEQQVESEVKAATDDLNAR